MNIRAELCKSFFSGSFSVQYPRKVPSGVLMIIMSTEEGVEEKRESEE